MSSRISVIVLSHGAGEALPDTLASLAAQPHRALEVLVMDDGTGAAAGTALPDDRFRLIREGALSRGAARGRGAAAADGEFLLFVDGGDELPPDALGLLVDALERSGSDVAMGAEAARKRTGQVWSWQPRKASVPPATGTDLRREPGLILSRRIAGKLFRRSFWTAAALEFPDIGRYDDLAVTVRALHLAKAVDVLPEVVLRRRNVQHEPTTEAQDIADGFGAVTLATTWLTEHGDAGDARRLQLAAVTTELRVFLDVLPDLPADEREQVVAQAAAYAATVPPKVFADAPALVRLKWHLAATGHTTELVKVVRYERGKSSPSIVRDPLRRYVVYPYWKDGSLDIPREVYRARDEVRMRGRVHAVGWDGDRLTVTGEAYINSVSSRRRWTSLKAVTLRSGDRKVTARARQIPKPGKSSGWSGFEFSLDAGRLRDHGTWVEGVWDVEASVLNSGVFRRGPLRGGGSGTGAHPPYRYVAGDVRIVPQIVEGNLRVLVEKVRVKATGLRWDGDDLVIEVASAGEPPAGLVLRLGDTTVEVPLEDGDGGTPRTRRARIDPAALADVPISEDAIDDTRDWTVSAGGRPLVLAEGVQDAERPFGALEVGAGRGPGGYLRVRLTTTRLLVTGCAWRPDGTLALTATHAAHPGGQIVLRGRARRKEFAFDLVGDGSGTLRAEVPVAAVPGVAGVLPLRPGRWDVLFRPAGGGRALTVRLTGAAQKGLPEAQRVARRGYDLETTDGRLVVAVTGDVSQEERSSGPKIREEARRRVDRDGLRDTVLYSCFNGRQYSDSPKAIHQELVRRGSDLGQLWVVNDAQVELPDTLEAVRLNGAEWQEAVATSRYIVTNHRLGDWFQRHPDQIVLQTWHGTPLKKIGKDIKEVHFAYAPGMKKALQAKTTGPAVPEWSHLLSPNPFSTEIFRRAFAFTGEIIEAGYPRNDLMHSPEADVVAKDVRARLGIPEGKKVVLYAPTWRDDQYYSKGRYKFDMRLDLDRARDALGDDHVLLVRLHTNVVDGITEDDAGFVRDVSLYPDITELYLIADMMISDYSSVMFDYANTGRPMLFFTYDLADYRDRLRGFYFDFEAEAPGPLVETSDALIEAIRDVGAATAGHRDRYEEFVHRFCPLDDGNAAARTVDHVFRSST
ncbi:bifunctional glycosyltransferase family 2 protein/CDP-glycerol:glycerophosphate glycerophosphotransferase [Actinomadura graeca]|uniref:Bifunctional glycosyltransferase family 2 protein/CDP-glycerol:glycerophosphate glycerophosphotransferase n=1 Tax=Actinomadura graeca TaxID=2750812 RepID=A0ABX8QWD2_9ACTN|nr:CDP-glycerol:glycerophosphate glycerophosphotransferase [Actinomadura graeca]QXJ22042.1 bifunctional glycosyltransferase family 2 protein/CDP-glycerol:glycerophosphate glycerophosphotransferase [Actinomadura graeca]